MPRILKNYKPKKGLNGRPPKYPWELWLDGQIRRLVRGKDFKCTCHSMINVMRRQAALRNVPVSIYNENDIAVVVSPTRNTSSSLVTRDG